MDGMPVTLIVKAPNQQIEDQTIQCELSWTISKLKGYLSEVYPSKPRTEEQKLIYSGQLLPDTVILKDVLRKFEGQEIHTVHLVCTPPRDTFKKRSQSTPQTASNQEMPKNITAPVSHENQSSGIRNSDTDSSSSSSENVSSDGIRQRLSAPHISNEQIPINAVTDHRTAWAAAMSQPYMQALAADPSQYAAQMAWMQQAYINYMTQYMQLVQNGTSQDQNSFLNENYQANEVPPADGHNVPENEQGNANPVVNIGNEPDEGLIDRDWLDWFYVLSRLTILFSIVYFYSSPLRFIIVVFLGFSIYLYQIGFFRAPALDNNNDAEGAENNNILRNEIPRAAENQVPQQANQNADPTVANNAAVAPEVAEDRPTVLTVMWTFFTTFFASLIPEIPNPV